MDVFIKVVGLVFFWIGFLWGFRSYVCCLYGIGFFCVFDEFYIGFVEIYLGGFYWGSILVGVDKVCDGKKIVGSGCKRYLKLYYFVFLLCCWVDNIWLYVWCWRYDVVFDVL